MRASPHPATLATLIVIGVVLLMSAGSDFRNRETPLSTPGEWYDGVTVREPIEAGQLTAHREPVLFWAVVVVKVVFGLPAVTWGSYRLFMRA